VWKLFTEELRLAVWNGQVEATNEGADYVEPRHLLLGVLASGDVEVLRVLSVLRSRAGDLEAKFRGQIGPPLFAQSPADIALSKGSKQAISQMYDYASQLNTKSLEPIHLLLGLSEVEDKTGEFLRNAGLRPSQLLRVHQRI